MDLVIKQDLEADVLVLKVKEGALVNEEFLGNDVSLGYDCKGKIARAKD